MNKSTGWARVRDSGPAVKRAPVQAAHSHVSSRARISVGRWGDATGRSGPAVVDSGENSMEPASMLEWTGSGQRFSLVRRSAERWTAGWCNSSHHGHYFAKPIKDSVLPLQRDSTDGRRCERSVLEHGGRVHHHRTRWNTVQRKVGAVRCQRCVPATLDRKSFTAVSSVHMHID
jgi:hypothetical protein